MREDISLKDFVQPERRTQSCHLQENGWNQTDISMLAEASQREISSGVVRIAGLEP